MCTAASPSDPTPSLNATLSFFFPLPLAIIPPSLLRCVWIPSPPTLPVTGPSVWPPLNCCCRLELCHSSSCCIVFGNDAYGTWSGKWVCEKSLAAAYMSCCLFHLGKHTVHFTHQSPDQYTSHSVAPYSPDLLGFWHLTNYETVWVCACSHTCKTLRLIERWEVSSHFMYIY